MDAQRHRWKAWLHRTSDLAFLVLGFSGSTILAQQIDMVGELEVEVVSSGAMRMTLTRIGSVHGTMCSWYPPTTLADLVDTTEHWFLQFVDRATHCPADTGFDNPFGYGMYTLTVGSSSIFVDFRDADYGDLTGYPNQDVKVYYYDSLFYTDVAHTNQIPSVLLIWDYLGKDAVPRIPVTVTNSFGGGTVGVDDTSRSAPYQARWPDDGDSLHVVAASPQTHSGLIHTFASWSDDGALDHSILLDVGDFGYQLTAVFDTSAPVRVSNLQIGGDNGDPVHISWDAHPHDSVDYYVYRKVRHNGANGDPVLLTTLPHSTTSYDDPEYVVASSSSDRLYYDVRAHHTPSNTFAQSWWDGGILGIIQSRERPEFGDSVVAQNENPLDYSLEVYPNPTNPAAMIRFGLPQKALVSLRLFDALGREVRLLLDEERGPGMHEVKFNAAGLASGMYIFRLQAHPPGSGEAVRSEPGQDGDFVAVKRLLILR